MKRMTIALLTIALAGALVGCSSSYKMGATAKALAAMPMTPSEQAPQQKRMLIWNASLSLEVADVPRAVIRITKIAEEAGGYVEAKSDSGESNAHLTLRVPVDALKPTMSSLEATGKVTDRRVSSEDVTEQYVDIDARMKTMTALRDRLRALLDKAKDVKDVLAIEKELGRVQADIDSMQARLKALKGKVDLATIDVSLSRRTILGPLGYILKGAWWVVAKLFVIQE